MRLRSLKIPDRMDESAKTLSYLTGVERSSMYRKYIEEGLARDWNELASQCQPPPKNQIELSTNFQLMDEKESNKLWKSISLVLEKYRLPGSVLTKNATSRFAEGANSRP